MKIHICKGYDEMSRMAANYVSAHLTLKSDLVLGLATGSTPIGLYKELINRYKNGEISFKNTTTFNLDEYVSLPRYNEQSYYTFMHKNLFDHVDIDEANINIPDGNVDDFERYAIEYEDKIKQSGGIDVQILGIGNNAHIGFNEPNSVFSKHTGVVSLTQSTIDANSRFFDSTDDVPKYAISMGIGTIFNAKEIILLASGKNKAEAIRNTVYGEIEPNVPASILQLHPNVILIIDEEAASML